MPRERKPRATPMSVTVLRKMDRWIICSSQPIVECSMLTTQVTMRARPSMLIQSVSLVLIVLTQPKILQKYEKLVAEIISNTGRFH